MTFSIGCLEVTGLCCDCVCTGSCDCVALLDSSTRGEGGVSLAVAASEMARVGAAAAISASRTKRGIINGSEGYRSVWGSFNSSKGWYDGMRRMCFHGSLSLIK